MLKGSRLERNRDGDIVAIFGGETFHIYSFSEPVSPFRLLVRLMRDEVMEVDSFNMEMEIRDATNRQRAKKD